MPIAQTICGLQGIHKAFFNYIFNYQPVYNSINRLCGMNINVRYFGSNVNDGIISQYPHQSAFLEEIDLILTRNFLADGDGECNHESCAFRQRKDSFNNLRYSIYLHMPFAGTAVSLANPCKQQSQVVVNLCG